MKVCELKAVEFADLLSGVSGSHDIVFAESKVRRLEECSCWRPFDYLVPPLYLLLLCHSDPSSTILRVVISCLLPLELAIVAPAFCYQHGSSTNAQARGFVSSFLYPLGIGSLQLSTMALGACMSTYGENSCLRKSLLEGFNMVK